MRGRKPARYTPAMARVELAYGVWPEIVALRLGCSVADLPIILCGNLPCRIDAGAEAASTPATPPPLVAGTYSERV